MFDTRARSSRLSHCMDHCCWTRALEYIESGESSIPLVDILVVGSSVAQRELVLGPIDQATLRVGVTIEAQLRISDPSE